MENKLKIQSSRKTELNIKKEAQEEKAFKYFGSITPHPNHKIFERDDLTGEIKLAEFIHKTWVFNGENKPEVLVRENCNYTSALNKKAAIKNFKSGKLGGKEKSNNPLRLNIYG